MTRYIDPDSTTEATVEGVKFVIGFWPPTKAERINLALSKLRKLGADDLKNAEPEVAFTAIGLNRELCEDAVRFSVRSWTWEGAPPASIADGALSQKDVDAIRLSGLLYGLATQCMNFNTLGEAEKKSSDSP